MFHSGGGGVARFDARTGAGMPVKKLIARETASAASHVLIHVTDEPLSTPCVTQRCVVENGASCANGGSVAAEREGSHIKERKNYEVLKSAVLKGRRLASAEREPVIAPCGDREHPGSVAERPVALQDAAARESREESDAVGVAHTASCVSGGPRMSSPENMIAMGSSSELREGSANQGTAAHVTQPQAVAGRTAVTEEIASPALHDRVNVPTKQPSAAYPDQRCVVENDTSCAYGGSEAAEPEGSPGKRRKRQSASPQCRVAPTHADDPAVVPSRARKRGAPDTVV